MGIAKDEVLMNICAGTQGCLEIDPDTSEPRKNYVYSKLIATGFASDILCSADERDSQSINYLRIQVPPRSHCERMSTSGQNASAMFGPSKHNSEMQIKE